MSNLFSKCASTVTNRGTHDSAVGTCGLLPGHTVCILASLPVMAGGYIGITTSAGFRHTGLCNNATPAYVISCMTCTEKAIWSFHECSRGGGPRASVCMSRHVPLGRDFSFSEKSSVLVLNLSSTKVVPETCTPCSSGLAEEHVLHSAMRKSPDELTGRIARQVVVLLTERKLGVSSNVTCGNAGISWRLIS